MRGEHRAVTGQATGVDGAPYGSDLRLLSGLRGIPGTQYWPGDGRRAHGPLVGALGEVHTTGPYVALLALDICGVA